MSVLKGFPCFLSLLVSLKQEALLYLEQITELEKPVKR